MKTNENGRSMIEMLGVLAIIGVLSVGGIYGYTMAMRKYKANEIAQTISMLATMAHAANAGLGDNVTLANSGLETSPAGVNMTGLQATCSAGCEIAEIDINGAQDSTFTDEIKKAVCQIVPTGGDAATRAGYQVNNCPS